MQMFDRDFAPSTIANKALITKLLQWPSKSFPYYSENIIGALIFLLFAQLCAKIVKIWL